MIETISKILTTDGPNSQPIVIEEVAGGCLICTSHEVNRKGYLQLTRGGKTITAPRLVYEAFYGPVPDGLSVCHHCDNPPCLNPQHFFAGTKGDNNRDKAEKGRAFRAFGNTWAKGNAGGKGQTWSRGEGSGTAKLTDEKVLDIRQKHDTGKYTLEQLGKDHGVHLSQIWRIVNRKSWRHLDNLNTNPLDNSETLA